MFGLRIHQYSLVETNTQVQDQESTAMEEFVLPGMIFFVHAVRF